MNKNKSSRWTRVGTFLLIALLSMPFLNMFVTQVNAQATGVKVEPPTQEIGADGVLLPTPPCTITISVTNVVDLFTWQIRLYFNSAILRYDEAWLPEGHVFDDKMTVPVAPLEGSDENGTYIDYGCSLILIDDAFAGSGILCQINFTGTAEGSSALSFSETGPGRATFLLNSWSQDMDFDVTDGNITVKGITVAKEDSEITLALSSEDMDVGGDVTISGAITPVQGIVNVTIKYKKAGEVSWGPLANVLTNSESQYTYTWITTEKGTYNIKASWPGDADTWPDESAPKTLNLWEDSEITLALSSEDMDVVGDVTISGAITPVQGIVNVTIKYKKAGEVSWGPLANVLTNSESQYTYTWTTTEKGTYDIKASWPGDADTWPDESAPKTLSLWEDSEITLALSSEDMDVVGDVTISGAITPVQGIVNVTIKYKKAGEVSWGPLANVLTNSESQYTYTWTTTEKGTYDIKASWPGDADTGSDESAPKTLRIGVEEAIDTVTYVIVGVVAVVVILAIVIYFVKFRKPE